MEAGFATGWIALVLRNAPEWMGFRSTVPFVLSARPDGRSGKGATGPDCMLSRRGCCCFAQQDSDAFKANVVNERKLRLPPAEFTGRPL